MSHRSPVDKSEKQPETSTLPRRHPITLENSPEETIERMRALPARAAQLRETISALREANSR